MKKQTINLEKSSMGYLVVGSQNTLAVDVGDVLGRSEVLDLVNSSHLTINIHLGKVPLGGAATR